MTSPVSIGDALAMAKLAMKLGRAFTKGRKSAPAEFREVENQLYSLSAALSALSEAHESASAALKLDQARLPPSARERGANDDDVLRSMLWSCEETLRYLDNIIKKYSSIGRPRDPGAPVTERWKRGIKETWMRIEWTTEGGDLATLRSQLTVHTNSLNLVLAVINHTQAGRIEQNIGQISSMLAEIHTWFTQNLRDQAVASEQHTQGEMVSQAAQPPIQSILFRVYSQSSTDGAQDLVCPRASIHSEWPARGTSANGGQSSSCPQKPLFRCLCTEPSAAPHGAALENFALSPLSFVVRLAGKERAWMLYKSADRSSGQMVSLVIMGIPAPRIAEFEDLFVNTLGARTARSLLRQNMETMLAYTARTTPGGSPEARVLDLIADLEGVHNLIDAVTLTMNGQSYTRRSIEAVQLLHYNAINQDDLLSQTLVHPADIQPSDSAELAIFYGKDDAISPAPSDLDRMIISLLPRTYIPAWEDGDSTVLLKDVGCTGRSGKEAPTVLAGVDVSFHLATPEAAKTLIAKLEDMKMELFVMSLTIPRPGEKLLLKLQARGTHTEDLNMAESEIDIFQSVTDDKLRLVVRSKDGCTLLSQRLAEGSLSAPGGRPNFKSPTYVVRILETGVRQVRLHKDGFQILRFSDVQSKLQTLSSQARLLTVILKWTNLSDWVWQRRVAAPQGCSGGTSLSMAKTRYKYVALVTGCS
ncbi:hypothetical protein C8A01DRAFT_21213 [Parachaetomium inaequale]|uniref:Fungal N-terminal domain-containing protein n=1 Tax=Parachaetomium inaequale TaxID=2588326 RepID=A0AAN6P8A8_9PEZI|nr:hypothetical protein C8A01DRAFT_21213 [Parachaetomium inaequale]